jgi:tetratricopeptide (TPR) repeat protein
MDRQEDVANQFRAMSDLFPESRDIAARYVDWLARSDQLNVAEDFLRIRAKVAAAGVPRMLDLIEFLAKWKGPDAVLADLGALIQSDTDPLLFRAMRATVVFQTGARKQAVADLETVIAEAAVSTDESVRADTSRYRIVLARMLDSMGDRAGAEAAIGPVIAERPNLADAALLQAQFQLDKGQATDAISTLRAALGADESDPQLLLLLARAHTAQGADALAMRTLSLAFGASGQSPETALIFAGRLVRDGRRDSAIDVLTRAISIRPTHVGLLGALGELYVAALDWNRAAKIIQTLRDLNGGAVPDSAADQLDLAMLAGRAPVDDALGKIQTEDPANRAGTVAYLTLAQSYMAAGRRDDARRVLDQGLEGAPHNALMMAVSARLAVAQGQGALAVRTYRDLIAQEPNSEYLWLSLAHAMRVDADTDAVLAVLDEGLAALPNSVRLGWDRALTLQQAGRPEDAIAAYEAVLTQAPDNLPAVNNLANLLSTVRQDDASLTRAADLARALDRSDIPQFRNTLGWIRFRQGDVDAAVQLLVPAAEALADDPVAQIQAAEALMAATQIPRAQDFLTRAIALAPPGTEVAARAREALAEIAALGPAKEG